MAPASPDARFRYPQPSRGPLWIWLVALVLHVPLVFVPVYRDFDDDPEGPALIRLGDVRASPGSRVVSMPFRAPPVPAGASQGAPGAPRTAAPAAVAPFTPFTQPVDTAGGQAVPAPVDVSVGVPAAAPTAGAGASAVGAPSRRIGPSYVSGRLWVRPLPVSPQELAEQLRTKTHMEKVDSAVHAIIQDYLDRLAVEEAGRPEPLPSWTTKIAGKTVGVDSKWIYLGPIRVPAFLLGLIPLNVQANPTQAEMNRRLSVMREDLFDAARRSANYADFKAAVTKLREEKQRERDLQKAQRTVPSEQGEPR